MPALEKLAPAGQSELPLQSEDWLLGSEFINGAGEKVTDRQIIEMCDGGRIIRDGPSVSVGLPDFSCLADEDVLSRILYHPADRFWLFQGFESLLFLLLAAAFLGLSVWWVRTKLG
jgi:hypothetical protein